MTFQDKSHQKFLEIGQAYSILGDEAKRKEYDASMSQETISRQPIMRQQRQNMKPDDWIQYRRANFTHPNPNFHFGRHQEEHYGHFGQQEVRENRRLHRLKKAAYYKAHFDMKSQGMSLFSISVAATLFLFLVSGDYIGLMFK